MEIPRRITTRLAAKLKRVPAIALVGPRQVGKTTLALALAAETKSLYLDLERPLDRAQAEDLEGLMRHNKDTLLLLDEVQRLPGVFSLLRGIIDTERRAGRKSGHFFLLGSASLDLLRQSGESLAGRISYEELFGIDALEWTEGNSTRREILWLRGGFPESLLAEGDAQSMAWRTDFITTYIERDIPQLGPRIPAATLLRFWTMLAHNQGALFNAAQFSRNLDIAGPTATRYLDLMVDLLLVRRIPPWTFNEGKRLVRSPKVYVRDSGLVHALLHIPTFGALQGHPVSGASWEGFVIENLLAVLPPLARYYHYRSAEGQEIDLLLELSPTARWAVEIKKSALPTVSKGFYRACESTGATRRLVVYRGVAAFELSPGVEALPLESLMAQLQQQAVF